MTSSSPALVLRAPAVVDAEGAVYWLMVLTPLLWALGMSIPAAAMVGLWALVMAPRPAGKGALVLAAWVALALAQAAAVVVNWTEAGESALSLPRRLLSTAVIGWAFIGVLVAVGYAYALNTARVIRGFAILGGYILALGGLAMGWYFATGQPELSIPSPVALLLPRNLPSAQFYFAMRIYHLEGFFGELMPRLTLFYPWTAGLALAGVGIFFVSMGDRARGWRWLGMAGGLAAVVLSFSRAGMIALVAAALAYLWLTLPRAWKGLTITAGMVAILAFIMTGNQFAELADDFLDTFASGRHGSSVGRDMIYERSWEGFTHSPILGNGWIGESVHVSEDLPIGSHSSVYGLLYTGGLLTFAAFVVALAVTGSALAAATAGRGGHRHRAAWAIFIATALLSYGESLFSLVLPCLPMFIWLGGALRGDPPECRQASVS